MSLQAQVKKTHWFEAYYSNEGKKSTMEAKTTRNVVRVWPRTGTSIKAIISHAASGCSWQRAVLLNTPVTCHLWLADDGPPQAFRHPDCLIIWGLPTSNMTNECAPNVVVSHYHSQISPYPWLLLFAITVSNKNAARLFVTDGRVLAFTANYLRQKMNMHAS